jgi:hypothetical protein
MGERTVMPEVQFYKFSLEYRVPADRPFLDQHSQLWPNRRDRIEKRRFAKTATVFVAPTI